MSAPLLSICIPTYNRAPELKQALSSIFEQINTDNSLATDVEVVVSNNASTDNTREIVADFQGKFTNLKYLENSENLGFDRNVLNVVKNSSGKYCLTLGDDDGILPGGISKIIATILNTQAAYILLNHQGYDHELLKPITPPNRQQQDDIRYETLQEFTKTINDSMSLVGTFGGMSTQLFNRQTWLLMPHKEKYIGTQTIHLFVIVNAFKKLPVVLMKEPTIMSRNANLRWDSFPGLESEKKRTLKTIETALWINDLYELGYSPKKIKNDLVWRGRINLLKYYIKKVIYALRIRKK